MADNYLGKKMEDLANRKKVVKTRSNVKSLDTLLLKNRSCRTWDPSYVVTEEQLKKIVEVNTKIPCAKNQQVLRFKLLTGKEAAAFCPFIKLGALLPDMKFPPAGGEPSAFIIICSTIPENKWVDMDLGISAQSMLLKAVEMGLSGICIGAFNKEEAKRLVPQGLDPLLAIALGKGAEKYQILHISEEENHNYFRKNGIHYIPKVRIEDLVI
ncbi:MAG: nitroreductase family protein [Bacteroidales bacterium]|nr:nitroreductase family protein [Bacteroidales bacterium]